MHAVLIQRAGCKIGGRKYPVDTVLARLNFDDRSDVAPVAAAFACVHGLAIVAADSAPARPPRPPRALRAQATAPSPDADIPTPATAPLAG